MSAAPAAARPMPPGRQGAAPKIDFQFASLPIKFWREYAKHLTHADVLVIGIVRELQAERRAEFVELSAGECHKWTGQSVRNMAAALSRMSAAGLLPKQDGRPGFKSSYGFNAAALERIVPRGRREIVQPAKQAETQGEPRAAALNCPLGHDCPVESVIERKDGVLINISPPSNQQVPKGTYEVEFIGEQKAKGTETRAEMVAWLHKAVPFSQVGEFLPAKMEAEIWKAASRAPDWVWKQAVLAKLRKVKSWALVVMVVVEAVQGWKRHGQRMPETPAPQTGTRGGLCPDCHLLRVFDGRCGNCGHEEPG